MRSVVSPQLSIRSAYSLQRGVDRLAGRNDCPICMLIYLKPVMLSCGHSFCQECVYAWLKKNDNCPICRAVTNPPIRNIALEQLVEEHRSIMENHKKNRITCGSTSSIPRSTSFSRESFTREVGIRQSKRSRTGVRIRVSAQNSVGSSSDYTSTTSLFSNGSTQPSTSLPVEPIHEALERLPDRQIIERVERNEINNFLPQFERSGATRRSEIVRTDNAPSSFGRQSFLRRSLNMLRGRKKKNLVEIEDGPMPNDVSVSVESSQDFSDSTHQKKSMWRKLFGKKNSHQNPISTVNENAPVNNQPEYGGLVMTVDGGIARFGHGKELLIAVVGGRIVGKSTMLSNLSCILTSSERQDLSGQAESYPDFVTSKSVFENGELSVIVDLIEVDTENDALLSCAGCVADAIIYVYSITDTSSILPVLAASRIVREQRKRQGMQEQIPCVLVGTYLGSPSQLEDGEKTAKRLKAHYMELDPRIGDMCDKVVQHLLVQLNAVRRYMI